MAACERWSRRRGSLQRALIGFAFVILCRIVANLVGGALSAPSQAVGPSPVIALATLATDKSIETWATLGGWPIGASALLAIVGLP